MVLLELIVQGHGALCSHVTDSGPKKFALEKGFNPIATSHVDESELLKEIILGLLFRSNIDLIQQIKESNAQDKLRGGLTVNTSKETLRLVKDFTSGATSLSQFKAEEKAFTEVSKDNQFIEDLLTTRSKLPNPEVYKRLFCVSAKAYKQLTAKDTGEVSKSADYFAVLENPGQDDHAAKRKRLQELKRQVNSLENLQKLEFQVDELQRQIFEKEEVLKQIAIQEENVAQLEKELSQVSQIAPNVSIPVDVEKKIAKFKRAREKQLAEVKRIEAKAEAISKAIKNNPPQPIHKNIILQGSIAGFVTAIVFAVLKQRLFFVIFLLTSLIGVGVAFFQHLFKQDQDKKRHEELDALDHEKRSLEKKYEIEMAAVSHLMARLQVRDPDDILELIGESKQASDRLQAAQKQLADTRRQLNETKTRAEIENLQKQVSTLHKKMTQFGAGGFDPMSVRREISELENELGISASQASFQENLSNPEADPFQILLECAANYLSTDAKALLKKISPGLETNVVTFTGRTLSEPTIENGVLTGFKTGKGGQAKPIGDLTDQEMALTLLACQFTLLQVLVRNMAALPVVVADLPHLVEGFEKVSYDAFRFLSQSTQVIFFDSLGLTHTHGRPSPAVKG